MPGKDVHESGQLGLDAARQYADFFVPALFETWAGACCDRALRGGARNLLDVACGTGIVAVEAARRLGPAAVEGVDCNLGMLTLATQRNPGLTWTHANVHQLPHDDASFDAVVCQFGLMFFEDRAAAMREMWRVVRPGGRLVIAVWSRLEQSPGYAAMVELLSQAFGEAVGDALRPPFCLGDEAELRTVFSDAGLEPSSFESITKAARFDSLDAWIHCDVRGWTLADVLDEADERRLRREAKGALKRFVTADGHVEFASPARIAVFVAPA